MNVLAIGATGFIGPHVVRRLVRAEHRVAVFHRGETEADLPASTPHIHGDRDALPEHLQTGFDWTYDLATDTRRIRDELGFNEPTAWDKTLERTAKWEQSRLSQTLDEQQFDYAAEDEAVA